MFYSCIYLVPTFFRWPHRIRKNEWLFMPVEHSGRKATQNDAFKGNEEISDNSRRIPNVYFFFVFILFFHYNFQILIKFGELFFFIYTSTLCIQENGSSDSYQKGTKIWRLIYFIKSLLLLLHNAILMWKLKEMTAPWNAVYL